MIPTMVWASFLVTTLAVARVTRLVTADRIMLLLRRWVINRWGEESSPAYLVHCRACSSVWIAVPGAIGWAMLTLPWRWWWLAIPAWLAMSHITILLAQLEDE